MSDSRYPIGPFEAKPATTEAARREVLQQLAEAPARLRAAVSGLSDKQLDTTYREGGWTLRQLVHHLADGDMNWYIRVKLALTEEAPTIKPFDQEKWAELEDAKSGPIEPSLTLYGALHARWVDLLESLKPEDWSRKFYHPERGWLTLAEALPSVSWHGRHHAAQIMQQRKAMLGGN